MKLSNLADVLRGAGLTVVETDGWANRGYAGQDLQDVRGVLWHHTATHRSRYDTSDAPTLSMCINGRSDLPGPLCNIVFGRTGVVYLVAAGVANHAGAGSAHNIPTNWGNHYLIGIEMESSGIAPWDWTAEQLRVAPVLGAALERAYGIDLQIAHYEYSSQGKIDPAGWPGGMDGLRASINTALTGSLSYVSESITPVQEDDMANVPQAEWEWAKQVLTALSDNAATKKDLREVVEPRTLAPVEKEWQFAVLRSLADNVATKGDADRIASSVATIAAQKASEGATVEQITEAVKQAISESVVAVDVTVNGGK